MGDILYSICIATWKPEGLERVAAMNLPRLESTEYVVSWQSHENSPIPSGLDMREDVRILRFDGKGISSNRNNALSHARGPVALTADDDLVYDAAALNQALEKANGMEAPGLALFGYEGPDSPVFPEEEITLGATLPKGFVTPAFVIALKRSSAEELWPLMFDVRFGPGSSIGLDAAEDEIMVLSARKKKIPCRYFPIKICIHPGLSTGHRKPSDGVLRASGAYIAKEYPFTALLRIVLKAKRLNKTYSTGISGTWKSLMKGWLKSFTIKL